MTVYTASIPQLSLKSNERTTLTRGKSAWLFGATGGSLGSAETISLHRTAGWWCARQSALHSAAYLLYYLHEGGGRVLWRRCFPVPLSPGGGNPVNRLGLINWFGVLACLPACLLALSALPSVRRNHYDVFQRLHLPLALAFTACCVLHDLPILLFAAPGLADWYLGRRNDAAPVRLRAKARTLRGTSGPWIELTMDRDETIAARMVHHSAAGCGARGRWASIRVVSLGRESHPFSVASVSAAGSFSVVVSANSGDWSGELAALARGDDDENANAAERGCSSSGTEFDVEVSGPFPSGGGGWSLPGANKYPPVEGGEPAPELLLIAGGTGITGWLPAMEAAASAAASGLGCRLVWCVKTEADYLALASRLPRATSRSKGSGGVDVNVFITRGGDNTATASEAAEDRERGEHGGDLRLAVGEMGMGIGTGRMMSAQSPPSRVDAASDVSNGGGDSCYPCASTTFDAAPIVSLGVALLGEL